MVQSVPTPVLIFDLDSEDALKRLAGAIGRAWAAAPGVGAVLVGLEGDLGAGKTTWVRGLLEGLGYTGRVPSPTYTLLEHYDLDGLDVVHVDLYRLGSGEADPDARGEVEALGLRDWLDRDRCWLFVEWPRRSAELLARCDVLVKLSAGQTAESRRFELEACSSAGEAVLSRLEGLSEP
ncbi:MAG: tRNA (adenosine(37)-N6)-threonylcarbamoyltransferase complex ATPase subunit type 1 TsaE [Gammaproteobacteria bacterium]|nr:tRNA (adenosine(37)-N6)-threonylcarbamoyltransferase complex ATPase subunit type 1 TsaE [Gammaproteobacteria bacterium]